MHNAAADLAAPPACLDPRRALPPASERAAASFSASASSAEPASHQAASSAGMPPGLDARSPQSSCTQCTCCSPSRITLDRQQTGPASFQHAGITGNSCCPDQTEAGTVCLGGIRTQQCSALRSSVASSCAMLKDSSVPRRCAPGSRLPAQTAAGPQSPHHRRPAPATVSEPKLQGRSPKAHVELTSEVRTSCLCHCLTVEVLHVDSTDLATTLQSPVACTFAGTQRMQSPMHSMHAAGYAPWRRACGRASRTASAAAPPRPASPPGCAPSAPLHLETQQILAPGGSSTAAKADSDRRRCMQLQCMHTMQQTQPAQPSLGRRLAVR